MNISAPGREKASRSSATLRIWIVPLLLLLGSAFFLPFDLAVARFYRQADLPGFLRELVENTEVYGHGIGVTVLIIAIALVHRSQMRTYVRGGLIVLVSGLSSNVLKFLIGRTRPRDHEALTGIDIADTFTGFFPVFQGITTSQSFPSGHTTVSWALAVVLSHLFPNARGVFFTLAVLVAYGRVQCGAHYPSDVFAGAALGWIMAHLGIKLTSLQWNTNQREPAEAT